MTARWALALSMFVASTSHAQDGGGVEAGSGLRLGAPVAIFPQAVPVALDPQNRIVVQPVDASQLPSGPYECWDATGVTKLNTLGGGGVGVFSTIFAGLAQTGFVLASWGGGAGQTISFTKVGCGVAAVPAGSFSFQGLFTPQNTGANVLPLMSNGDPVYATTGGLVRVSLAAATPATSVLLTTAALDAAIGSAGLDGGVVDERLLSLSVDPADHLWAVVERRATGGERLHWYVEVTPAGQVTVRRGPIAGLSAQTEIVHDPGLGAMLIRAQVQPLHGPVSVETLAVIPRTGPDGLAALVAPWPIASFPDLRVLVGGGTGSAKAVTYLNGFELRPLQLNDDLADFDRDGLKRSEEQQLGTSDFLADTDGDGVPDGLEVRRYGTDPTDAGSAPARGDAGPGRMLAESIFSGSWLTIDAGLECIHHSGVAAGPALSIRNGTGDQCGLPGGTYRWLKADGTPLSTRTGVAVNPPVLTPDLGHAFLMQGDLSWQRLDLQTGSTQTVDAGAGVVIEHVLAFSKDVVIGSENYGRLGEQRLWRVGPQGAFAVIDSKRPGCPILGDPSKLAACATAEHAFAGIQSFDVRGWDPIEKLALVVTWTDHGTVLLGVGEDRVVYLTDLLQLAEGNEPIFIGSLGAQGFELQLGLSTATMNFSGSRAVDPFFQPMDGLYQPLDLNDPLRTGNFFRHGFFTTQFESYLQEKLGVGAIPCKATNGIFTCSMDNDPFMQHFIPHAFTAELIPVGPGIEKGEVIFFAAASYGTELSKWRGRDGSYGPFLGGNGWRLWRLTPLGAALPWLDANDFASKVGQKPLAPITSMGASADGLALCLVEPANGRVWELTLDANTRQLAGIALTEPPEGAAGCAYDSTGKLAVLTKSPALIRSAGRADLPVTGALEPTDLLRLAGRWVVASESSKPSHCVSDDGTVVSLGRISAISPAFGGVAWLDEAGEGFLSPADAFCAGTKVERLGASSANVWMDFFGKLTFRSVNAARGAIAMRPDGVMIAGTADITVGGLGVNPQSVPTLLFAHFPAYTPLTANRMTEVDAFRAPKPRAIQAARKPIEISAMVLVPGAPADTDFGHLIREPAIAPSVPDAGSGAGGGGGSGAGGGSGGGGTGTKPCGCNSAPGGLAVLLLLAWRRRRSAQRAAANSS